VIELAPYLAACHLYTSARILQPSRTKTIDSAGKITILRSGKATTRAKRRITARVEGTGLRTASPRGHSEEQCRSLEIRGSVRIVPHEAEVCEISSELARAVNT